MQKRGAKSSGSKLEKLWRVSSSPPTFSCWQNHIILTHLRVSYYDTSMDSLDMKANNYEVAEAGETITFRGLVARSTSQAFFLTFCTALGMASLALVLQIQFQDLGKTLSVSFTAKIATAFHLKSIFHTSSTWHR